MVRSGIFPWFSFALWCILKTYACHVRMTGDLCLYVMYCSNLCYDLSKSSMSVAHAMLKQSVNLSARLVPCHLCPSLHTHSFLFLSHDSDWWKLVRLKILSPFWPLCMLDPMLFCVSALSCATKLAEALILLGQENPLVLVPELRWVGFWSLDPLWSVSPDVWFWLWIFPLVTREIVSKKLKQYVYNMSTIITCIMSYMLYIMKSKARKWNCKLCLWHKSKRAMKWNC